MISNEYERAFRYQFFLGGSTMYIDKLHILAKVAETGFLKIKY
jgi:hypothetical protein